MIYHLKVWVYDSNNYAVILYDKSSFYNIIFLVNNSLVILGFLCEDLPSGVACVDFAFVWPPWRGAGSAQCSQINSPVKPYRNVPVLCVIF